MPKKKVVKVKATKDRKAHTRLVDVKASVANLSVADRRALAKELLSSVEEPRTSKQKKNDRFFSNGIAVDFTKMDVNEKKQFLASTKNREFAVRCAKDSQAATRKIAAGKSLAMPDHIEYLLEDKSVAVRREAIQNLEFHISNGFRGSHRDVQRKATIIFNDFDDPDVKVAAFPFMADKDVVKGFANLEEGTRKKVWDMYSFNLESLEGLSNEGNLPAKWRKRAAKDAQKEIENRALMASRHTGGKRSYK